MEGVSSWQTKLSTVRERNLYVFDKSLFCDVELSVVDANGDKASIPAHKYVLAISSPVFEAMFYSELAAENGRTINLSDCTKEGLQQLLRYVYSDEVNLTGSNVMEVLYAADKYMLPFLKEKCHEYLEKELKPEDVFGILPQIRAEKLEKHCWDMVDNDTQRAVSSESFLNISKEMLCRVLRRETLSVDEVVLFQAVEKWALNKIREEGLEDNRKNKRVVLGEEVIKLIRFPLMSQKEFGDKVLPCGILKMDEVTELIRLFNGSVPSTDLFIDKKRKFRRHIYIPNNRFHSFKRFGSFVALKSYDGTKVDAIDFKVNKAISLDGVRLFGSKDCIYNVTMKLYKGELRITKEVSTIPTKNEQTDGRYYGFTFTFNKPVPLDPHVQYTIQANINGSNSYYGVDGQPTVECEDVVITYMDSKRSTNGTSQKNGQFPTIIFKAI